MASQLPHYPTTPTTPWVADDDDDYDYYWTGGGIEFPIPRWLAEIIDVPAIVRWEIFMIGFVVGLIVAAFVVLIAVASAV